MTAANKQWPYFTEEQYQALSVADKASYDADIPRKHRELMRHEAGVRRLLGYHIETDRDYDLIDTRQSYEFGE